MSINHGCLIMYLENMEKSEISTIGIFFSDTF